YPPKQVKRLFPVPFPMLPERKKGRRHVDVIFAADFYNLTENRAIRMIQELQKNQQLGLTTGLIQMSQYTLAKKRKFNEQIRKLINGSDIQMLVYGEEISSNVIIIQHPEILNEW